MLQLATPLPDLLALHRFNPPRYPYLLESVAHGGGNARYSILFAFPEHSFSVQQAGSNSDFLRQLDQAWQAERCPAPDSLPELPFRGGWFVYAGYELAAEIEPSLQLPANDCGLPTAFASRIPAALIMDHQQQQGWLVAEEQRSALLEQMLADVQQVRAQRRERQLPERLWHTVHEDPPEQFLDGVRRIRRYIREGDVFQVNLSRAWRGQLSDGVSYSDLYQRLRQANPAPFAGLARYGQGAIVSSSPERLARVDTAQRVDTRPIAGTRPRGRTAQEDQALAQTLLAHVKERAEHVMLIDLERNDLGRVCRPGTVRVDELMVLESYAHVHHIVSNVCGQLREGTSPGQVLAAVFPGGTITGCPKVRCMQIIAELEQVGRGPYTGSMGYLNRDGSLDFNILIRTLAVQQQQVQLRAGAGIVHDSEPERELAETRAKARGLLLALGETPDWQNWGE